MRMTGVSAVICLAAMVAGCGAKTPSEVVKAWAGAHKSADIEDVMYYSFQDQLKPRIDLKNEAQREREERSLKREPVKNYWSCTKSGDLVREFIRGERAWVILDRGEHGTCAYELKLHQGNWKVLDNEYSRPEGTNN